MNFTLSVSGYLKRPAKTFSQFQDKNSCEIKNIVPQTLTCTAFERELQ